MVTGTLSVWRPMRDVNPCASASAAKRCLELNSEEIGDFPRAFPQPRNRQGAKVRISDDQSVIELQVNGRLETVGNLWKLRHQWRKLPAKVQMSCAGPNSPTTQNLSQLSAPHTAD